MPGCVSAGSLILIAFLPMDRWLKNAGGQDHHHPAHPSKNQARVMFFVAHTPRHGLGHLADADLRQARGQGRRCRHAAVEEPLFVLPIVAVLGEHVSPRAILGALITIAGVAMLFVFSM